MGPQKRPEKTWAKSRGISNSRESLGLKPSTIYAIVIIYVFPSLPHSLPPGFRGLLGFPRGFPGFTRSPEAFVVSPDFFGLARFRGKLPPKSAYALSGGCTLRGADPVSAPQDVYGPEGRLIKRAKKGFPRGHAIFWVRPGNPRRGAAEGKPAEGRPGNPLGGG